MYPYTPLHLKWDEIKFTTIIWTHIPIIMHDCNNTHWCRDWMGMHHRRGRFCWNGMSRCIMIPTMASKPSSIIVHSKSSSYCVRHRVPRGITWLLICACVAGVALEYSVWDVMHCPRKKWNSLVKKKAKRLSSRYL